MTREITATEWLPAYMHARAHTHTHKRTHTCFVFCANMERHKTTFWSSHLFPVGFFPCSYITRKIKLFCDFISTRGNFSNFRRSITDPWEKGTENCKERQWPPISAEVQLIFDIFTPSGAMASSGKAHMPQWGCDDTIYHECVCRVPPLPLRTPFRLLSPHQPTHTWLRPLGHSLLRMDVFIAPQAYVP